MAIETLRPTVGLLNSLPASEDRLMECTHTIIPGIPEHILPYAERAAEVGYLSKFYLLPYTISQEHREFLRQAGFAPGEAKKRGKDAMIFLDQIQREGFPVSDALEAEHYHLLQQYQQGLEALQKAKVGEKETYARPDDRVAVASDFISNLLHYPRDRRMELLEAMGFSKNESKTIMLNLTKALVGTVGVNIVDGPALNAMSLLLGHLVNENISQEINNKSFILKSAVVTTSVLSVVAFHASNYYKSKQIGRAVKNGVYLVPNVAVAATAMSHGTMIHPQEVSLRSDIELFMASIDIRKSPQTAVDELLWWLTWFANDYGVTFALGNLAGTVSSLAQIGYMETLIQYTKYMRYLEAKHSQGFQLEESDVEEAHYLLSQLYESREYVMKDYELQPVSSKEEMARYDLGLSAISTNSLYSIHG